VKTKKAKKVKPATKAPAPRLQQYICVCAGERWSAVEDQVTAESAEEAAKKFAQSAPALWPAGFDSDPEDDDWEDVPLVVDVEGHGTFEVRASREYLSRDILNAKGKKAVTGRPWKLNFTAKRVYVLKGWRPVK
jgi:hypothetical protein